MDTKNDLLKNSWNALLTSLAVVALLVLAVTFRVSLGSRFQAIRG